MLIHSPVLGVGLVELDAPRQISARDGCFLGQASQTPAQTYRRKHSVNVGRSLLPIKLSELNTL